ncbi:MAG: hypothetical protein ACHBN1_09470 [Heteroscytonema crispum UTEX LB 1556]
MQFTSIENAAKYQFHPTTNKQQRPFGRTSTRRETLPQYALHQQPTTNNQQPITKNR